jgi:hypothetical protein
MNGAVQELAIFFRSSSRSGTDFKKYFRRKNRQKIAFLTQNKAKLFKNCKIDF